MNSQKTGLPKFSRIDADARRRSLIEATARCLVRDGFEGATVRRICKEADVSAGLLRHYFDGKDDLVGKTYDAMAGNFARITHDALKPPPAAPEARLRAFFEASFTPDFINADVLLAWTAFWRLIRSDRRFADMHRQVYGAYRDDLAKVLAEIAEHMEDEVDSHLAALSLTGLIDGLWLEINLDPTAFTADEAIGICRNWLDSFMGRQRIGRFNQEIPNHDA